MADPPGLWWSHSFGDNNPEVLVALDVATDNRIYVCGDFQGYLNLGGGNLVSQGEYDIFLAAFSPDGTHLWSRSFGDSGNDKVRDLIVDGDSNIIIVGDFFYSIDLGGGLLTSAGDKDAFVAKYSSDGNHLWSTHYGDMNYQSAQCVTVGSENHISIAGQFAGEIDLGGGPLYSMDAQDLYLAVFDFDGSAD